MKLFTSSLRLACAVFTVTSALVCVAVAGLYAAGVSKVVASASIFRAPSVRLLAASRRTSTRASNNNALQRDSEVIAATELDGSPLLQHDVDAADLLDTPIGDALIASEDGSFWTHHGVNWPRLLLSPFLGGGASTLTMQVARTNVLRDRSVRYSRKALEIAVAWALERSRTKPEILRAYGNSIYVGTSRGYQIRGFAAAAAEFFGADDIRKLDVLEGSTIVALLNAPAMYLSHLRAGDDLPLRNQRNRVIRLMQRRFPERYAAIDLAALTAAPVVFARIDGKTSLRDISRNFLDVVATQLPVHATESVRTTLDPACQRAAVDEVHAGLAAIEERFPSQRGKLQAALVSIDIDSGGVVAMIGGRDYETSQYNRAVDARRQLGSTFKPFVYLAAFERAADEGRTDLTPASVTVDEPTTFIVARRPWRPANYDAEYGGAMTLRLALDQSRNIPAVKVAEIAGLDRVASLWEQLSGRKLPLYPSIALGAVEASPMELAAAYRMLARAGQMDTLRVLTDTPVREAPARQIVRPQTAFIVADMLRGVFTQGTAVSARQAGFMPDAAGKTGTTNDLRDAWFVGFTRTLLTVVWVGRDDNLPIGMTGAQAALPIWTAFMKRVLSPDEQELSLVQPAGIAFANIDVRSGRPVSGPSSVRQAFIAGTEPRR